MDNNIPQPKFAVGEQVVIESKTAPKWNGQVTTVLLITKYGEMHLSPIDGLTYI